MPSYSNIYINHGFIIEDSPSLSIPPSHSHISLSSVSLIMSIPFSLSTQITLPPSLPFDNSPSWWTPLTIPLPLRKFPQPNSVQAGALLASPPFTSPTLLSPLSLLTSWNSVSTLEISSSLGNRRSILSPLCFGNLA